MNNKSTVGILLFSMLLSAFLAGACDRTFEEYISGMTKSYGEDTVELFVDGQEKQTRSVQMQVADNGATRVIAAR